MVVICGQFTGGSGKADNGKSVDTGEADGRGISVIENKGRVETGIGKLLKPGGGEIALIGVDFDSVWEAVDTVAVTDVGLDELVVVDVLVDFDRVDGVSEWVDGTGKTAFLVKVLDERDNLDETVVVDESEDGIEKSENEYVDEYVEELDRFEDELVELIDELNESDELVDLVVER